MLEALENGRRRCAIRPRSALLTQARLTLLAFAGRQRRRRPPARHRGAPRSCRRARARSSTTPRAITRASSSLPDRSHAPWLDAVATRAAESARPLRAAAARSSRVTLGAHRGHRRRRRRAHARPPARRSVDGALIRWGALLRPAVEAGEWWRALHRHVPARRLAAPRASTCTRSSCSAASARRSSARCASSSSTSRRPGRRRGLDAQHCTSPASRSAPRARSWACSARSSSCSSCAAASWPEAWRRALLWNLVLLGAIQIFIGFQLPMIDNAAHIGGMLGGAAVALHRRARAASSAARRRRASASSPSRSPCVAGFGWAGVEPWRARRSSAPSSSASRRSSTRAGDRTWRVPHYWERDAEKDVVDDPYLGVADGLMLPAPTSRPDPDARAPARSHCQERSFAIKMTL